MPPLARRNLFHDKVRLTVTPGIVFSVVLIVVELGLFGGSYPRRHPYAARARGCGRNRCQ